MRLTAWTHCSVGPLRRPLRWSSCEGRRGRESRLPPRPVDVCVWIWRIEAVCALVGGEVRGGLTLLRAVAERQRSQLRGVYSRVLDGADG